MPFARPLCPLRPEPSGVLPKIQLMRFKFLLTAIICPLFIFSQIKKAPEIKEGEGPWDQLIIRGVILINGTGSPPFGPVDIVVEKNRIKQIVGVGAPGLPISNSSRPKLNPGG